MLLLKFLLFFFYLFDVVDVNVVVVVCVSVGDVTFVAFFTIKLWLRRNVQISSFHYFGLKKY